MRIAYRIGPLYGIISGIIYRNSESIRLFISWSGKHKLERTPLVVLDTNVLVAGLCRRQDSPSYRILQQIQIEFIPLALTHKLYLEYESVLTRDRILKLIKIDRNEVNLILHALVALAQKSETYYLWRPNLTDEQDNFIIESAIATGGIIITKNTSDFRGGELKFPELVILTPQQFCDLYIPP